MALTSPERTSDVTGEEELRHRRGRVTLLERKSDFTASGEVRSTERPHDRAPLPRASLLPVGEGSLGRGLVSRVTGTSLERGVCRV